ncbi:MAG: histidine ammonia-lyase, partial [Thermoproteota archaeon]|nr:histidine ammonia-lyase [Thermoproteota archaeon]
VTTGFGALSNVTIHAKDIRELQTNLIRSHSTGVGEPLDTDVTRALMLLRANALAKGNSGIRLETLETLVQMLNKKVHPIIPQKGSVGASGDLAPLAHMTLVMTGEGEAEYQGKVMNGKEAMEKAGIRFSRLEAKEGLALINGTQMMTAIAALAVYDAERLVKTAEIAAAMSLEALCGISDAFDERIHQVRPHPGQVKTACNIRLLTAGSQLIRSGEEAIEQTNYPQDPYCLRCTPQVLGAVRDAVNYVRKVVEIELNSATDNPLVFGEDEACLSGGNFHGQPISTAMDFLATALTTVGNISERRIAMLLDEKLSRGLPGFLIPKEVEKGIHSGFMSVQYTAAALTSENKSLAHPASVDSIPTSANFEDFVSMGPAAARKAAQILRSVEYIVAIELLCAAQAIDFRGSDKLGEGTKTAYSMVRKVVSTLKEDRVLHKDIEAVVERLVRNSRFVEAVANVLEK